MKKTLLILFILLAFGKNAIGQITSDSESSDALNWLIENPQIESYSIFAEKATAVFKWQAINYPNILMRVKGVSEFMDSSSNYKFFKEIIMIYSLSEFDNQINKDLKKDESAYYAMKNVLTYYSNIIQINPSYKNPILDKYSGFSEERLRKKIKRL